MAKIASYAMRDPVFRRIVSTREYSLPRAGGAAPRLIKTSNELLKDVDWVNGIKTGSTPWAGYCLVSSATKNGLTLISVVLGAKDQDTREAESKALLTYGFERCGLKELVDGGVFIAGVPALDPLGREVRLVTASSYTRRLLGEDAVTGQVKLSRDLTLPVTAGEVLGKLQFFQGDANLGTVPLVAAQSLGLPTLRMILDNLIGPWSEGLALTQFLESAAG
jgi:D-alanyl-D-alanine carboxypeptidase (penicillin-binding protein 5/6)